MRRCVYLIHFGLSPKDADELPIEVDHWLLPVWLTIRKIENG